jgi:carbon monoxide dehydrogenase subunit G
MRISGEHRFTHSSDEVWKALVDPAALAATLPGARRLEPTGPDEYAVTVDVGVGSVKGTYDGTFALADKEPPHACTVRASASGRPGSVSVVARMRMAGDGDADALLTYEADATVTGPLAGVGQRLMGAAARRTTEQFLKALDDYIAAPVAAGEAVAAGEGAREIERARPPVAADTRVIAVSALTGFALALVGVAVGRWTRR